MITRGVGSVLLGVVLSACGVASSDSSADQAQRIRDTYEIEQIEKAFHGATTHKDIDQMVNLFAPNATMTVGPGETAVGLDEIRRFWLEKAAPFAPENEWISDHPAYKLEVTVNGDRGTLHFECHYVDAKTGQVASTTAADFDVARIDEKWVITNMVAKTTVLEP